MIPVFWQFRGSYDPQYHTIQMWIQIDVSSNITNVNFIMQVTVSNINNLTNLIYIFFM